MRQLCGAWIVVGLASAPALAVTYVVPEDRELVRQAELIVTGTVVESDSEDRDFTTVSSIEIDATLKAGSDPGARLELVEKGGTVGERGLMVPGAPRYRPGQRVLVFASRNGAGRYETLHMDLGRFEFVKGSDGRLLLVRGSAGEPVFGWTPDGGAHREPVRDAAKFLSYVRDVVAGRERDVDYVETAERVFSAAAAPAEVYAGSGASEYLIAGTDGARWNVFPAQVAFRRGGGGAQSGVSNGGISGIEAGIAAWNGDSGSNVNYTYSGTTSTTAGLCSKCYDDINSIQFNDPRSDIAGSYDCSAGGVLAIGAAWYLTQRHSYKGEALYTAVEGDVVVQNGIECTLTNGLFDQLMMHELGHTLGFRHSDEDEDGGGCSAADDCTSAAVMAAWLETTYGASRQSWDTRAVRAVYGPDSATGVPAAPSNLTAQVTGPTNATLRWKDNANNESDFLFYYSASGIPFTKFGNPAAANSDTYLVSGLVQGVVYQFRLTARNASGESAPSNVVSVNTQTAASCVPSTTVACVLNGRFRVSVRYRNVFDDLPANADALRKPVTGFANPNFETAFFYFNSPDNIEMMVKMLDQGNVNLLGQPTIAVLTGSATPLRIEVNIFDTKTGASRTYTSPYASQRGATDFTAFVK